MEYSHRSGFGARAEVLSFDRDVRYGQLGLIYRFGKQGYKKTLVEAPPKPEPVMAAAKAPEPPPRPDPCVRITGVLDGVRFQTDSHRLTASAKWVLNDIAFILAKCPTVPVRISAHTDSRGTEKYNQALSQRRAWSVIHYLRTEGIDLQRLYPEAHGESMPIDTNETANGRRNNRRVELIASTR